MVVRADIHASSVQMSHDNNTHFFFILSPSCYSHVHTCIRACFVLKCRSVLAAKKSMCWATSAPQMSLISFWGVLEFFNPVHICFTLYLFLSMVLSLKRLHLTGAFTRVLCVSPLYIILLFKTLKHQTRLPHFLSFCKVQGVKTKKPTVLH